MIAGVFPSGTLADEVHQRALALAAKSPGAVRQAKALINAEPESVDARILKEGQLFAEMLQSPEFAEAATAFMERRKPDFSKFG